METVEKIARLLRESGKQQRDLCVFLGLGPSVFSEWKSGVSKSYRLHIGRIAEFLGCTVDYLLNEDEFALSPSEQELLQLYRSLSDEGKAHVRLAGEMAKSYDKRGMVTVFRASRGGETPGFIEITREEAERLLGLPGQEEK